MARPRKLKPDKPTLEKIEGLARVLATHDDFAGMLGVSTKTFSRFVADHEEVRDAIEKGNAAGRVSLRARLFSSKSPHALIFLARAVLKLDDRPGASTVNVNLTRSREDLMNLSDAELETLIVEACGDRIAAMREPEDPAA
jgi:hypothetical protein